MTFNYYYRLSSRQQQTYRASDRIATIPIPAPEPLRKVSRRIAAALAAEDRSLTQTLCNQLVDDLGAQLSAPRVRVSVRAARPSRNWGELHGLYEPAEDSTSARIVVWMRTAKRRQIVAYKTFLRTLLHEVCHHLDYTCLRLPDSYHTEGFYKRESSLYIALTGEPET
jgi:hypothetical protein